MDSTSSEFSSLVETHRRLAEKYTQARNSLPMQAAQHRSASIDPSDGAMHRADGVAWSEMAHAATPRKLPYPAGETQEPRCCPRCHYTMEPKNIDVLPMHRHKTVSTSSNGMPPYRTEGMMGVNHMISLQLASMEYARLLSALRTGSCLNPSFYHEQQSRPFLGDPGRHEDLMQMHHKRKNCESETEAASTQRTIPVKRTRLVWTPDLHQRFVAAVEKLGLDKAVPKAILEMMGVEGLTRENVASHLQKYRLQQGQIPSGRKTDSDTEKLGASRSPTIRGSIACTESESTESVTNHTGEYSTTAMPVQK